MAEFTWPGQVDIREGARRAKQVSARCWHNYHQFLAEKSVAYCHPDV
jgi:hypothetical protein